MKGYSPIVRMKFRIGVTLGLLAAIVIISTDIVTVGPGKYHLDSKIQQANHSSDDNDDKGASKTYLTITQDLVIPVSQLVLIQEWHFIGEIVHKPELTFRFVPENLSEHNSWFRTLFRSIISPNAP